MIHNKQNMKTKMLKYFGKSFGKLEVQEGHLPFVFNPIINKLVVLNVYIWLLDNSRDRNA